jgi:putative ABC transport system permease protein
VNLQESIVDGLTDVGTHKLRTFLQTLGVILGVGSLVAVQGLADSGRRTTTAFFAEFGGLTKLLVVNKQNKNAVVSAKELASHGLTWDDALALKAEVPQARLVDPIQYAELRIRCGDFQRREDIIGVTPDYTAVYKFYPARGRFVTADDLETQSRVVVLGDSAARLYFGNVDPLGKTLYLDDVGFTVVGIMKRKEFYFGDDSQNAVEWMNRLTILPLTSIYARFTGDTEKRLQFINVMVDKVENNPKATQAIKTILYRRHGGVMDFEVVNRADRLAQQAQRNQVFNYVFMGTGIVSLIVGGIVIMNIMLASFQERIREIGIRKALGAGWTEIVLQFLIESLLVTAIGGTAGLGLGIVFAKGMSMLLRNPTVITAQMMIVGVVSSVVVGLFFGLYPAIRAASLNPVQALRYE